MILTYQYRILPTKAQHGVLAAILESQRQLYNAALEERIGAYRRGVTRTYFDQSKALTEWRQSDPDAVALRIRVAQRSLTRKQHSSGSRRKARIHLARCHAAIARARSNHLHEASARLVRDYDVIALEALNISGLARGVMARDVYDASWARFISMLRYKAERAGVRLVEVDPRNSSQDCSGCGLKVPKRLDKRRHECPHCGLSIDRDLNAARNILNRAGVGPGLPNVADYGKRAGGNLDLAHGILCASQVETLP